MLLSIVQRPYQGLYVARTAYSQQGTPYGVLRMKYEYTTPSGGPLVGGVAGKKRPLFLTPQRPHRKAE